MQCSWCDYVCFIQSPDFGGRSSDVKRQALGMHPSVHSSDKLNFCYFMPSITPQYGKM